MNPVRIFFLCAALVFAGVTLAFYALYWLLSAASPPDEIGARGHGCILSTLWLLPLCMTGLMFGLVWL